jgi:hypothetical protein
VRTTYRVLAWILALEVVVQAAVIAWALFGLGAWIMGGGVLDAAGMEGDLQFDGVLGFMIHGINGQMVVPVVVLALLVVSFFAKLPRGVAYAGTLVGLVAVQILLGIFAHSVPMLGLLHGAVALAIVVGAVMAARLAAAPSAVERRPAAMV